MAEPLTLRTSNQAMTGMRRRLARWWDSLRMGRYRARARRSGVDDQRFEDRQARHEAGIFEQPGPGAGGI